MLQIEAELKQEVQQSIQFEQYPVTENTVEVQNYSNFQGQMNCDLQSKAYATSFKHEEKDIVATIKIKQERDTFNELGYAINRPPFCAKEEFDVKQVVENDVHPNDQGNKMKVQNYLDFQGQIDSDLQSKTYDTSFKHEEKDIFIGTMEVKQEQDMFNKLSYVINQLPFSAKEEIDVKYHEVESDSHPSNQEEVTSSTYYNVIDSSNLYQTQYEKLHGNIEHSESDRRYKCEKCSSHIDTYTDAVRNSVNKYDCNVCSKKMFSCNVYSKTLTGSGSLTKHMRLHTGNRLFSCNICSKTFRTKSNLTAHIRIHSGNRPYSCNVCGVTFSKKDHLNRHMRIHTGDRPYSCNLCSKAFSQKSSLMNHMRVHADCILYSCKISSKPYSCNICSKTFNQSGILNNHMRIHTGDRPYSCNLCSKAFSQKSNLIGHIRIHSGNRPYSCNICSEIFRWKYSLISHIRAHT